MAKLLCIVIILVGCSEPINAPEENLAHSLNQLLDELGSEQKNLHRRITNRIAKEPSSAQPNLLILQAAMAIADDKLEVAQESIHQLMNIENLSKEQMGLAYLLQAAGYYALGQVDRLDASLNQALLRLDDTTEPMLKLWLESYKTLLSAYRENNAMFDQSVNYVLLRVNSVPNNLLGQSMLNIIAIGLTTGRRFNEAIDVENIKVGRDEAFNNLKGLSDSYYNLGTLYRRLMQPELALLNFMQCLEYSEQLGSERDQAFALQQMTVVALTLNDEERAVGWARKAHSLALASNVKQLYIPTKITLARVIAAEKPHESKELLKEARALSSEFNVLQFIDEIDAVEKMLTDSKNTND